MFKKFFVAIAVLGFSFAAVAQNVEGVNARIDAMGGCGVIGDIGWTVGKPSALYAYPDQIQASGVIMDIEGLAQTYGQIIAIKSFGEHFFVGMTLNDKRALSGTFYNVAKTQFGFLENFTSMKTGRWFPNWPRLNICIKPSDNFTLGIGGFLEHSKYDEAKKKELKYSYEDAGGDTVDNIISYDSTVLRKYFGGGIIIDARIWFGESGIKLNPEFKVFIPKLEGNRESNAGSELRNTNHNVTDTVSVLDVVDNAKSTEFNESVKDGKLPKNLYLRAGSKLSGTIGETFWIGGFWYKTERFELNRDSTFDSTVLAYNPNATNAVATTYSRETELTFSFNKRCYDWWLGCQPSFSDNLVFCPEYSGGYYVYDINYPPSENRDTTVAVIKHKFRLGVEGSIKNIWIFKEMLPRFGLTYTATREITNYKVFDTKDGTLVDEDISWPYISNWDKDLPSSGKGAKISAGLGLKGKRSTFDISFDVLEWREGAVVGPQASIVTFTLDLGKRQKD